MCRSNPLCWTLFKCCTITMLYGHENKASCLNVSPYGTAICTGSTLIGKTISVEILNENIKLAASWSRVAYAERSYQQTRRINC